jgi:N utilization substance protein B
MAAPGLSVSTRRKARGLALQVLYALDVGDVAEAGDDAPIDTAVPGWIDDAVATYGERFELDVDPEARGLAVVLVRAATSERAAIDERIAGASRNWRIDRMARVDRNILRLAVGELMHLPETPVKVVINEAVELAKRFGTAESPAFVNGVLDRIATGLGTPGDADGGAEPAGDGGSEPA